MNFPQGIRPATAKDLESACSRVNEDDPCLFDGAKIMDELGCFGCTPRKIGGTNAADAATVQKIERI